MYSTSNCTRSMAALTYSIILLHSTRELFPRARDYRSQPLCLDIGQHTSRRAHILFVRLGVSDVASVSQDGILTLRARSFVGSLKRCTAATL